MSASNCNDQEFVTLAHNSDKQERRENEGSPLRCQWHVTGHMYSSQAVEVAEIMLFVYESYLSRLGWNPFMPVVKGACPCGNVCESLGIRSLVVKELTEEKKEKISHSQEGPTGLPKLPRKFPRAILGGSQELPAFTASSFVFVKIQISISALSTNFILEIINSSKVILH
ncbi:hypothetical protein SERLA73DRAFT_157554 [Serpula lacrymans var. lacrymans S7.3]|uniref:Uncharacterized protein n=1 Tax=Serpula lacrymans var. lacrymans (strain S7.3) TaxID=936435 RepID=F8QJQ7_SERL3|nr:hypothetical protein SERLA73DRAFT_157554 [Serpula lacrymans var. lacrymans S7.3]